MKLAMHAIRTFYLDIKHMAQHAKLNRIVDFVEQELPVIYEELVTAKRRIEELEARLRELEG